MYAVIFTAQIAATDNEYLSLATDLRQRAMNLYGCTEFISSCESGREIALSYWPDLDSIRRWKNDELHLKAQQLGQTQWYRHYRVQICELLRQYDG